MKRRRVLLLFVASLFVMGGTARAASLQFEAFLDGLQETPPNASPGYGSAMLTLNDVTGAWTLTGTFDSLISTTNAAHIHGPAAPGASAAVIAPLTYSIGVTSGTLSGSGTFTAPQMADLQNGLYYVNLHTQLFPGGEVRGQFAGVPEPGSLVLLACGAAGLAAVVWLPAAQRAVRPRACTCRLRSMERCLKPSEPWAALIC